MWYVIQVMSGEETDVRNRLLKLIPKEVYDDIFIPRYVCTKRYEGNWHEESFVLFPGYIFVDVGDINKFRCEYNRNGFFYKILGDGKDFVPISKVEQHVLEELMNEDRIITISKGFIEGDKIKVTEGPLSVFPATIKRVDRHKRIADIEVMMFGVPVKAKVGLEVIKKI
ncbi:MAG: antiterminator LoaP [Lachnospiraceae bacterium]|nr:antiterminator LoaP [Lachnospiraceae bacterium]